MKPLTSFLEADSDDAANKKKFDDIVKKYVEQLGAELHESSSGKKTLELEVGVSKFLGAPIEHHHFTDVVSKLKSIGFVSDIAVEGYHRLTVAAKATNATGLNQKRETRRVEIHDISYIQHYCNSACKFMSKSMDGARNRAAVIAIKKDTLTNSNNEPFSMTNENSNFSISLRRETVEDKTDDMFVELDASQKVFRLMNRTTFEHPNHPLIKLDVSMVKQSMSRIINDASFNMRYEIEIEVINQRVMALISRKRAEGSGSDEVVDAIAKAIRRAIRIVMCGLQNTNYPVKNSELVRGLIQYHQVATKEQFSAAVDKFKWWKQLQFIGYDPVTLQYSHLKEDAGAPNILSSVYVATEKADGLRTLLFINDVGKIYKINSRLGIAYTGVQLTKNVDACKNSILDGELVLHDRHRNFINRFMAFDIYFIAGESVRALKFINFALTEGKPAGDAQKNTRLFKLAKVVKCIRAQIATSVQFDIRTKEFFPTPTQYHTQDGSVFSGCKSVFSNKDAGKFDYDTDGLILTPAEYGVGGIREMDSISAMRRFTWDRSFKWKPPELNTVDFLVDILNDDSNGFTKFKTLTLNCAFDKFASEQNRYKFILLDDPRSVMFGAKLASLNNDDRKVEVVLMPKRRDLIGKLVGEKKCHLKEIAEWCGNPIADVINNDTVVFDFNYDKSTYNIENKRMAVELIKYKWAQLTNDRSNGLAKTVPFRPTLPKNTSAGTVRVPLVGTENSIFTEKGELVESGAVVECAYDMKTVPHRWRLLNLRPDKTMGNTQSTANSNWMSINAPISKQMLIDAAFEPKLVLKNAIDDNNAQMSVYYAEAQLNGSADDARDTQPLVQMRNFHGRIKEKLIVGLSEIMRMGESTCNNFPIVDLACGVGGDLNKWHNAKATFVLGINLYPSDLNMNSGMCDRYLKKLSENITLFNAAFLPGDSRKNIKSGRAFEENVMISSKEDQMMLSTAMKIMASSASSAEDRKACNDLAEKYPSLVNNFENSVTDFSITSCQFALHYMWSSKLDLLEFVNNVYELTRHGGYFVGTSFDGHAIFDMLKEQNVVTKSINKYAVGTEQLDVWSMTKKYDVDGALLDDDTCIGLKIEIDQHSIGGKREEYLVNYTYLDSLMREFGFDRDDSVMDTLFGTTTGMFKDIISMPQCMYNDVDREISHLNRCFIYKKTRRSASTSVLSDLNALRAASRIEPGTKLPAVSSNVIQLLSSPRKDVGVVPERIDPRPYFRNMLPEMRQLMELDKVATYSVTKDDIAKRMSELIAAELGNDIVVLDGMACIGGNTISFGQHFSTVLAVELDKERFRMLQNNVMAATLTDVVQLHQGSILDFAKSKGVPKFANTKGSPKFDVLFLDPEWGGPGYDRHGPLKLSISKVPVETFCINMISMYPKLKMIALKLPPNGDIDELMAYCDDNDHRVMITPFHGMKFIRIMLKATAKSVAEDSAAKPPSTKKRNRSKDDDGGRGKSKHAKK